MTAPFTDGTCFAGPEATVSEPWSGNGDGLRAIREAGKALA